MSTFLAMPVHAALKPYIRTIRIQHAPVGTAPYKVLPGPLPVAGFQSRGRLHVLCKQGDKLLDVCGITGLQTTARSFAPQAETMTLLITFEPYGAFALLGCPMNEIAEQHIGLESILPSRRVRNVSDRLREAPTSRELSDIVQSFFLTLLEQARQSPHPLVLRAVRRIAHDSGRQRIETVADDLAVSRRQLERLFQRQIGVGPKEFASLTRFDWLMKQLPRRRSWTALAHETGFADQAHFIRHFVARTGSTPREYARRTCSA